MAFNLALFYARHERPQSALQFLAFAVEKDPRNRDKARDDEAFDSLRNLPEFQRLMQ